jgi:ribosomal protein L7/L12
MAGEYSSETINAYIEQTNARLAAIESFLSVLASHAGIAYVNKTATVPPEVVAMAQSGDRIGAMKLYRELTGAGLAEAQAIVAGL